MRGRSNQAALLPEREGGRLLANTRRHIGRKVIREITCRSNSLRPRDAETVKWGENIFAKAEDSQVDSHQL
jgi:hypothetical protein